MNEEVIVPRASLLTTAQVAAILGVSKPVLRKAWTSGQFLSPTTRYDRFLFWLKDELVEYIDKMTPQDGPRWQYILSQEGMARLARIDKDLAWWRRATARLEALPESWWHFLKRREIVELLETQKSTINSWIKEGLFPAPVMISKASRWTVRDVARWLECVRQAKGWSNNASDW